VIGQFGVGFYSVFMVAERVEVVSRSYQPDGQGLSLGVHAATMPTFDTGERDQRGTDIIIHLREDAKEFLQEWNLKQIIRKHSDYVAFPIYVGDDEEPTNKRKALWRQQPSEVEEKEYVDFYKMLTMDFMGKPLHHIHMRADVPLQFYALLYVPSSSEPKWACSARAMSQDSSSMRVRC
jgi:HSP90 family molecular chaperone